MPTIEEIRARADAAKAGDRISYANLMLHAISDELFLLSEIDRLNCVIVGYQTSIHNLNNCIDDLRNELCLQCGKYHEANKGACDGCRWKRS